MLQPMCLKFQLDNGPDTIHHETSLGYTSGYLPLGIAPFLLVNARLGPSIGSTFSRSSQCSPPHLGL